MGYNNMKSLNFNLRNKKQQDPCHGLKENILIKLNCPTN